MAKITLKVTAARRLCSMFSSARRGLEQAAQAPENLAEAQRAQARRALRAALRRAETLMRPAGGAAEAAAAEDGLAAAEAEQDGGEEVAEAELPVPCTSEAIRFLESCFNIDSGAHSDAYPECCRWFRACIFA